MIRQVEQHSKEDYAKKAFQWAKGRCPILRLGTPHQEDTTNLTIFVALKLYDPSIKLILCGKNGHSDWDRYVIQECIKYTDMHSIHMYTSDKE